MLPRNKLFWFFTIICVGWVFLSGASIAGDSLDNSDASKNIFIKFYQDHISGADGGRCPMTPSCSEYAAQAMKKHGTVVGWIMACDRLVRCGRDEAHISPHVRIKGTTYISNPVSANDFWWFTPDPPKLKEPFPE